MGFDKFCWLKAVYADPKFPAGEKAVLAYVTAFSVQYGKDSFRVRQSTLADAAHSGISRQTVGSAIRRAKRHGYLAVVSPHAPGRTHHTAETLQLLLPAKNKEALHDSSAESCKANGGNGVKQTAELCKAANSPTSENHTPNSSSNGSSEGSGAANNGERTAKLDSLPDWATPPPKCLKHPNGYQHDDDCRRCGALRRWDENADKRRQQNYDAAWTERNKLGAQARSGMYGDWRPERPPRFRSEFDPNVPWEQPNPPPEADLSVNGYDRW